VLFVTLITLGLFSMKPAAIVLVPQSAGVATAGLKKFRKASQPRTSRKVPFESETRTTAALPELIRWVIRTPVTFTPEGGSGDNRPRIWAPVRTTRHLEKRLPTRAQSSKILGCGVVAQKATNPASVEKSGGVPSPS
jgi:hypothetical protein